MYLVCVCALFIDARSCSKDLALLDLYLYVRFIIIVQRNWLVSAMYCCVCFMPGGNCVTTLSACVCVCVPCVTMLNLLLCTMLCPCVYVCMMCAEPRCMEYYGQWGVRVPASVCAYYMCGTSSPSDQLSAQLQKNALLRQKYSTPLWEYYIFLLSSPLSLSTESRKWRLQLDCPR